ANINGVPWDANYMRCYRQNDGAAGWWWYHKYLATEVVEHDSTGGSPDERWTYDFSTARSNTTTLWHFDSDATRPDAQRSWTDFAGYSTVTVTHGAAGGPTTVTKTLYFRGLDHDRTGAGDYTRSASITDSAGTALTDQLPLRGTAREEQIIDGATVAAKTIHTRNVVQTGQRTQTGRFMATVTANRVNEAATDTSTWIAATSSWRTTRVQHDYEPTY